MYPYILLAIIAVTVFTLPVAKLITLEWYVPRWRKSVGPGAHVFYWEAPDDNPYDMVAQEGVVIKPVEHQSVDYGPNMVKVSCVGHTAWVKYSDLYPRRLLWLLG